MSKNNLIVDDKNLPLVKAGIRKMALMKEKISMQRVKINKIEAEKKLLIQRIKKINKSRNESKVEELDEKKYLIEKVKRLEYRNKEDGQEIKLKGEYGDSERVRYLEKNIIGLEKILLTEREAKQKLEFEKSSDKNKIKQLENEVEGLVEYKKANTRLKDNELELNVCQEEIKALKNELKIINLKNYSDDENEGVHYELDVANMLCDTVYYDQKLEIRKFQNYSKDVFEAYEIALNHKISFDQRITDIEGLIQKKSAQVKQITSTRDHPEEILNFLNNQIENKNKIKNLLTENQKYFKSPRDNTIVIQKKNIKKHRGHGGSWKVAYADFVTAMMAFFLLMWLLSQLSQDSRDNLQEYFENYKAYLHSGKNTREEWQALRSTNTDKSLSQEVDVEEFKKRFEGADEHLKIENASGGVRIQVMDLSDKPMFETGSAVFRPETKEIMEFVALRLKELPGNIIIEGHTDSSKFVGTKKTNWELSMERASAARMSLVENGMDEKRIKRIVAYGYSEPINPNKPFDPKNRRINIIILNRNISLLSHNRK